MEDILASIRRIIADDQTQGTRSSFGAAQHAVPAPDAASQPDSHDLEPAADEDHFGVQARTGRDGTLDLADIPSSFARSLSPDDPGMGLGPNGAEMSMSHEHDGSYEAGLSEDGYASVPSEPPAPPEPPVGYRPRAESPSRFRARSQASRSGQAAAAALSAPASAPDPVDDVPAVEDADASDGPLISPMLGASVMSAFETLAGTVVLQNTEMLERVMRELLRPLLKTWLDENLPTLVERLVRSEIERVARGGRG